MRTLGAVGGKAAVNDTFIQRLFVKFFTDVLIESTGQEVVAVFAYECLHVGSIFISFTFWSHVAAWESQLPHILHFKGKIQLCVLVSRIKLEDLKLEMNVDKCTQMSKLVSFKDILDFKSF